MIRATVLIAMLTLSLPLAALAQPAAAPSTLSATQPATQAASQPSGKWTCWTGANSLFFGPQASTPGALWFSGFCAGHIWRYDLKTQQVEAFSALDGLPLAEGWVRRVATASDERCAVLFQRGGRADTSIFLWEPKKGWRALPVTGMSESILDICFDSFDHLIAMTSSGTRCEFRMFERGNWNLVCTAPEARILVPVKGGYLVINYGTPLNIVDYVPGIPPYNTTSSTCEPMDNSFFYYFRSGDKTLCFATEKQQRITRREKGFEATSGGFKEALAGKYVGLDLKDGKFFDCKVVETTVEHVVVQPPFADSPQIELRFDSTYDFQPIRDTNGHLWVGRKRWDGHQWKTFTSGFESDWVSSSERFRLSEDGTKWSPVNPDMPIRVSGIDAEARTAWVPTSYTGKGELRLTRFADGKREVLRTVPYDDYVGEPQVKDAGGDWWWRPSSAGSKKGVLRMTSTGIREYPLDDVPGRITPYAVFRSPKGRIWCWRSDNTYARYDSKKDAFVPDEKPLDEFAFDFGKWRLSYMPDTSNPRLYMKTPAGWSEFKTPFSDDCATVYKNPVYQDRLLVSVGFIGVLEYNATLDKWIRLAGDSRDASFDYRGRRILTGVGLLVYDGDPWAAAPAQHKDDGLFDRLLRQMDDEKWKVRDEATREMAKNMGKFGARVIQASEDPSLSLEVRSRLKRLLPSDAQRPGFPQPPPAIFRAMHPLLVVTP